MQASNLAANNLRPFLSSPFAGSPGGNLRFMQQGQFQGLKERENHSYYANTLRAAATPAMNSAVSLLEDSGGGGSDYLYRFGFTACGGAECGFRPACGGGR